MRKKPTPLPYVQPYRYASPNIPLPAIRRFARRIAEKGKVLYEARGRQVLACESSVMNVA